jgi:hypothetical protein
VAGVGRAPRLTMTTKDIRHFQLRPEHVRASLWSLCFPWRPTGRPRSYRVVRRPPGRRKKSSRPPASSLAPNFPRARQLIFRRRCRRPRSPSRPPKPPPGPGPPPRCRGWCRGWCRCRADPRIGRVPAVVPDAGAGHGAVGRGPRRHPIPRRPSPPGAIRAPSTRALTRKAFLPRVGTISRPRSYRVVRRPPGRRKKSSRPPAGKN